ncbi:MAG TPA: helix-turn-helix domain-containing protein [Verrucomicrobiota bacterium]|nr:helix-turn-helix domain-containing protein [Verrucomicrobiota bacterium]HNU51037.1 helix-turn-helix domain-containing protein [Verrucomicrobiota bacterium]
MSTVGDQLRQAREASGLTIRQVADITKMRGDHVQALEEGNYDAFVAPVYIRGFARTYARLLHLDEAAFMAALDEELNRTEKFREHPSLTGANRTALDAVMLRLSRIPWRIAAPAAVILLAVVCGVWIAHTVRERRAQDPLTGLEPARYQPAAPATGGETLPLPSPAGQRR